MDGHSDQCRMMDREVEPFPGADQFSAFCCTTYLHQHWYRRWFTYLLVYIMPHNLQPQSSMCVVSMHVKTAMISSKCSPHGYTEAVAASENAGVPRLRSRQFQSRPNSCWRCISGAVTILASAHVCGGLLTERSSIKSIVSFIFW